jgi:23S rRNA (pseudouridine1915-N3)-methyltransferase
MRVVIASVGRLKEGPDAALFERYWTRFRAAGRSLGFTQTKLAELAESRAAAATARCDDEANRLLAAVGQAARLVALDERGKMLDSAAFAQLLVRHRDDGAKTLAFAIGGPDGHGAAVLDASALKLSLGSMTLPHGLARIVLAEQLYRAATILSGHPYHRA